MARKATIGVRKPMAPEVRARIAEACRLSAEKKRQEAGVFVEDKESTQTHFAKPLELSSLAT